MFLLPLLSAAAGAGEPRHLEQIRMGELSGACPGYRMGGPLGSTSQA